MKAAINTCHLPIELGGKVSDKFGVAFYLALPDRMDLAVNDAVAKFVELPKPTLKGWVGALPPR